MQFRSAEIARVTGGTTCGPDVVCEGATQDSRALVAGQLFVPIVAERDGHDFIVDAIAAGAPAYVTARDPLAGVAATAIVVTDTLDALRAIGSHARRRLPGPVVAITGSVGKTSTKDLTASALGSTLRTHASERSFNNEIGVPLTLANAPDATEAAVLEMGARGSGHLHALCAIARPTIGVVTCVADAHTAMFGSLDQVALAKGELIEALPSGGAAILNATDPRVRAMAGRTDARTLFFGDGGDVAARDVIVNDDLTSRFTADSPWGSVLVELGARGRHNVDNALAALAVAGVCDVPLDAAAAALRHPRWSPWRMELVRTGSGARILNDAYNASPSSMAAALRALAALPARRRIAILGVMAELGSDRVAQHRAVADLAAGLGIEVIAVDAPDYGAPLVRSIDDAVAAVGDLHEHDAVLVKGSRVAALERVVERLLR